MCEKYNRHRTDDGSTACADRPRGALAQVSSALCASLWPSSCVVCHRSGEPGIDLCAACRDILPPLADDDGTLCPRCGELVRIRCVDCEATLSPFARLVVPWRYAFPLDALIRRMKYHDERTLARVLGTALAREAGADAVRGLDALIAVPSRASRREGGFDHAAALARWCAREARVADGSSLAGRVVDTGSLAGLSRAERQDRIRGAFRVDERVVGRHVAIVDDVMTSGATAGELARELYDTGAASVGLWVLARTPAGR